MTFSISLPVKAKSRQRKRPQANSPADLSQRRSERLEGEFAYNRDRPRIAGEDCLWIAEVCAAGGHQALIVGSRTIERSDIIYSQALPWIGSRKVLRMMPSKTGRNVKVA